MQWRIKSIWAAEQCTILTKLQFSIICLPLIQTINMAGTKRRLCAKNNRLDVWLFLASEHTYRGKANLKKWSEDIGNRRLLFSLFFQKRCDKRNVSYLGCAYSFGKRKRKQKKQPLKSRMANNSWVLKSFPEHRQTRQISSVVVCWYLVPVWIKY